MTFFVSLSGEAMLKTVLSLDFLLENYSLSGVWVYRLINKGAPEHLPLGRCDNFQLEPILLSSIKFSLLYYTYNKLLSFIPHKYTSYCTYSKRIKVEYYL